MPYTITKTLKKGMKTITKKQFLSDVMREIDMLRLHATDGEKTRLNFRRFNPNEMDACIYGQLTRDCASKRAKELMDLSCARVFSEGWKSLTEDRDNRPLIGGLLSCVNGGYSSQDWVDENGRFGGRNLKYISCLEGYIYATDAKNEQIIQYIKGEIDTLVL